MQQVFTMMNEWLKVNSETRKRMLQIRTYKIVPLSEGSGVLEWCEGTEPMGKRVLGKGRGGCRGEGGGRGRRCGDVALIQAFFFGKATGWSRDTTRMPSTGRVTGTPVFVARSSRVSGVWDGEEVYVFVFHFFFCATKMQSGT